MSDYAISTTGRRYRLRYRTGAPRPDDDDAPTWREILRQNADFPGAILRFYRSLGTVSDRSLD